MCDESQYRMLDTSRPDGCYIRFERILPQADGDPKDFLFQDPEHEEADRERLAAFWREEWTLIGVQARADIQIIRSGTGTVYAVTSPGIWSVESDSSEEYLEELFQEECETLKEDLQAFASAKFEEA